MYTYMPMNLYTLVCITFLSLVLNLDANPKGMRVIDGTVTSTKKGLMLEISAKDGAIVEWDSFSNDELETININLPNSLSSIFMHVKPKAISEIHGGINCNGCLYLLNNKGITIGSGAYINCVELFIKGGAVVHEGTIRAQNGNGLAGIVTLSGGCVILKGTSRTHAFGDHGGGVIHIGGGWRGQDPAISNAKTTVVNSGAVINADATQEGGGGTVIIWSDHATIVAGLISAQGAGKEGSGGLAAIASDGIVQFSGIANLNAADGTAGNLMLEPNSAEVVYPAVIAEEMLNL